MSDGGGLAILRDGLEVEPRIGLELRTGDAVQTGSEPAVLAVPDELAVIIVPPDTLLQIP
jgi:hypothetical protein